MDLKNIFLVISTIVGFITPIIGVRAILLGNYKPHRTTRLIYVIVSSLFVATLFAQGDKVGIVLAVIQLISTTIIFLLTFKYGMGGTSKTDMLVLAGALITLFVWKTTDNPTLALYMSIATDLIGTSPTLIKSFKKPFTEDPKFYASDSVAGFFNLISLRSYNLYDLAFPGYIFLINFFCMSILLIRQRTLKFSLKK